MICFKSIGSSVLAMSLVFGDKVIMLDLSKWHKSNRYGVLTHRQKWHSLNRNAWHYETEITGTNRTEVTTVTKRTRVKTRRLRLIQFFGLGFTISVSFSASRITSSHSSTN